MPDLFSGFWQIEVNEEDIEKTAFSCEYGHFIIYSQTIEEHLMHIDQVITLIAKAGLKIKPDKYEFVKTEIIYLGQIVSSSGIKPNPKKIDAVVNYPAPVNVN